MEGELRCCSEAGRMCGTHRSGNSGLDLVLLAPFHPGHRLLLLQAWGSPIRHASKGRVNDWGVSAILDRPTRLFNPVGSESDSGLTGDLRRCPSGGIRRTTPDRPPFTRFREG